MPDPFIVELNQSIRKDDLAQVLNTLLDRLELDSDEIFQDLLLKVQELNGRLTDLENQVEEGLLRTSEATLIKNQIRKGILSVVDKIKDVLKGGSAAVEIETSELVERVETINREVNTNQKVDVIFKYVFLLGALVGIGLIVLGALSKQGVSEQIVIASLGIVILCVVGFFYSRIKEIENQGKKDLIKS